MPKRVYNNVGGSSTNIMQGNQRVSVPVPLFSKNVGEVKVINHQIDPGEFNDISNSISREQLYWKELATELTHYFFTQTYFDTHAPDSNIKTTL